MSQQIILIGTAPNDGSGNLLRDGWNKANSNFTELYAASTLSIPKAVGTTKGDIIIFTGSGAAERLGVGSNGQVLTADSAQTDGVKWATPASGGITSLGGATGVITLSGLTIPGNVLTSNYNPTSVAITGGAIDGVVLGGSDPRATTVMTFSAGRRDGLAITKIDVDGNLTVGLPGAVGADLRVVGVIRWGTSYASSLSMAGDNVLAFTNGVADQLFVVGGTSSGGGMIELRNGSSLGNATGGARIGAIGGEMHVLDASGNDTVISPHATQAPTDLYDTGPGSDEMHATINRYTGLITWHNETRRRALDALDLAARLGTHDESVAAWAAVASRQMSNQIRCTVVETFADYQARTGASLWPGPDDAARMAYAELTPAQRWDFVQAAEVARAQASHEAWQARRNSAVAAILPFTEVEPALYTAQPAPSFLSP